MSTVLDVPIVAVAPADAIAPGWTDGRQIFIRADLSPRERRTVLRHERAHLWLDHFPRRGRLDPRVWRLSTDLEIARNIYDSGDLETIEAPRSRLAGAIVASSLGVPEGLVLAEEIYDWLVAHPPAEQPRTCCSDGAPSSDGDGDPSSDGDGDPSSDGAPSSDGDGDPSSDGDGDPSSDGAPSSDGDDGRASALAECRRTLDRAEAVAAAEAAAAASSMLRQRPPTLPSLIDAALRQAIASAPSYRRPSRRDDAADVILRGRVSAPRTPRCEIYVDRSGSFEPAKTAAATARLQALLRRYRGSVRADVVFFGNGRLMTADPQRGTGNTPYDLVVARIAGHRPELAIVVTDDDPVGVIGSIPRETKVVVVPIGCAHTRLAAALRCAEATA